MNKQGTWLGALGGLFGVGDSSKVTLPQAPGGGGSGGGGSSSPPGNFAQPQAGFSASNPGPAWATWDSYPTYIRTVPQPVLPYTAACGGWSAPLGKGEIDGFLYSTAVMMVEHSNGQPVTQQTRSGLYLFAIENEMVTVRKCLSPNVPIQQAKFADLKGLPVGLSGMPVGLGGCGPGCTSCPFCKGETNAFGGTVVGVGDSCGHVHPAICLPDPPAFPTGEPCGGPPIPLHYLQEQRGASFTGLGGCGGTCLPDPPAFPTGEPCGGPPIPLHYLQEQGRDAAFTGVGAASSQTVMNQTALSPGAYVPSIPTTSTAAANAGPQPQWSYQDQVQPGVTADGYVTPITYVPVAEQMPLRPPGKMAYQPTLPWWTAWHKSEQQAFNCWWVNQQFAQPVCGLGAVANMQAVPAFDELQWVMRMGVPFNVGVSGPPTLKQTLVSVAAQQGVVLLAAAAGAIATVVAFKSAGPASKEYRR